MLIFCKKKEIGFAKREIGFTIPFSKPNSVIHHPMKLNVSSNYYYHRT